MDQANYGAKLFSFKKEGNLIIYSQMDEIWRYYTKRDKPGGERQITTCYHLHVELKKKKKKEVKLTEREGEKKVSQGLEGRENRGWEEGKNFQLWDEWGLRT